MTEELNQVRGVGVAQGALSRPQLKALTAPTLAALERVNLNARPLRLARWLVKCTLARGVNFLFAPRLEFIAGPLGFNRKEIHEILHGYLNAMDQPVAGLVEIGFVRVRECADDRGWLLTVQPDASRWEVAAVYSSAQEAALVAEVDAVRLAFARQLESGAIGDWFPDLDVVLDEVSLESALRVSGGHDRASDDVAGPVCSSHGVTDARGIQPRDARRVRDGVRTGVRVGCCSQFGNKESVGNAENRGVVPKLGTTVKQLNSVNSIKQITVQQLNSAGQGDNSNRLLAEFKEQLARAHGEEFAEAEMINSGGMWRGVARRWPREFEMQVGELRNFIQMRGRFRTNAVFYFQNYFKRAVEASTWQEVCDLAKKSKESFSAPV